LGTKKSFFFWVGPTTPSTTTPPPPHPLCPHKKNTPQKKQWLGWDPFPPQKTGGLWAFVIFYPLLFFPPPRGQCLENPPPNEVREPTKPPQPFLHPQVLRGGLVAQYHTPPTPFPPPWDTNFSLFSHGKFFFLGVGVFLVLPGPPPRFVRGLGGFQKKGWFWLGPCPLGEKINFFFFSPKTPFPVLVYSPTNQNS